MKSTATLERFSTQCLHNIDFPSQFWSRGTHVDTFPAPVWLAAHQNHLFSSDSCTAVSRQFCPPGQGQLVLGSTERRCASSCGPGAHSQHAVYLGHCSGTESKTGIQIVMVLCLQLSRTFRFCLTMYTSEPFNPSLHLNWEGTVANIQQTQTNAGRRERYIECQGFG